MNEAEVLATIAAAKQKVERQEGVGSTKAGWLMIIALLVESWDSYSMAFILVFLKDIYHPNAWLLGFTAAGVHLGALVGSLAGGWATDYFGRRKIFLASMIIFIVCALLQGLMPNMYALAVVRLIGGIPIGCDIANGFTYIMEVLPKSKREVMGNRWQFMFAVGTVMAIVVVTLLQLAGVAPDLLWRIVLMVPAIPALGLLLLRTELPETPAWLLERGRFKDSKIAARTLHGDLLDYLPDENYHVRRPTIMEAVRDVWHDKVRRRASIFGWVANVTQGAEFYAFGFYVPLILVSFGFTTPLQNNLFLILLNCLAALSAFVGPLMLRRIGHKGLTQAGTAMTIAGLLTAAFGVAQHQALVVAAGATIMLWGHYWDAESGMTVASVVARPRYRGAASGFGYGVSKLASFIIATTFPVVFATFGVANAAVVTAIFPLITLLLAIFVLPEVFGHTEDVRSADEKTALSPSIAVFPSRKA